MSSDKDSGRRLRVRERRRYTEEYADEEELLFGGRAFDVDLKLESNHFDSNQFDFVKEMTGEELTVSYLQKNGFEKPVIIKKMTGLGMKMPEKSFSVWDVKSCVGSRRVLDVMDVQTQRDFNMTMKEWCNYYNNKDRERLLNVISLEFSHTKLEQFVDSPYIVKQVDWIDWVWPKHLKQSQTEGTNSIEDMKYPKVQKYCLMSVKGCYTDFHIDFGGTSVWYHILKGRKVFWLIPPTERNIQLYEQWVLSGKQSDIFFGDTVSECARIELEEGNTFFIPTGWIHAVFTPEDSLVFGGNFLHSFGIEKQLRVAQVEDVTKVPAKFRYPFYTEVLWYVLARYVYCLMNKNHLNCNDEGLTIASDNDLNEKSLLCSAQNSFKSSVHLTPFELSGLKAIIMWLSRLPPNKRSLPDLILSAESLLNDAKLLIDEHSSDSHQMAITGRPAIYWSKKTTNSPSVTSQLRQIKHPSFALKQMRNKELKESSIATPPRPESPPTRPISSNQYAINSGSALSQDLIPSSFAGLIAQTGVNHYQPFTSFNNPNVSAPILSGIPSAPMMTTSLAMTSVSHQTSLPPPPPLISTSINHNMNTFNTNNINFHSLPKKEYFADNNPIINLSNNMTSDKVRHNSGLNESQNRISSTMTSTQTQNITSILKSCPTVMSDNKLFANQMMTNQSRPFPTALPPSGFHSSVTQNESHNKMVNSSTQSSFPTKVSVGTSGKSSSNDSSRRRRTRCKKCDSCLRADCGECHFCKDMKKFGGPGRMKQSCIARQCLAPVLPHTACCMICGRDGWEKLVDPSINDETASSLMECSQCWEIVHPFCLNEKFPLLASQEAHLNEDLPNSWECPRCVKSGSKSNSKSKSKTILCSNWSSLKKEDLTTNSSFEKRYRIEDESPPTTDDEEENKVNKTNNNNSNSNTNDSNCNKEETEDENSSGSSHVDQDSGSSFQSKQYSLLANNSSAHVRSCARFPLLSQGLKAINSNQNNFGLNINNNVKSSSQSSNGSKPEVKGLAALMNIKKKNETSRDRLFKSLKGLKRSSELSVRFNSNNSQTKKSKTNSFSQSNTSFTTNNNSNTSTPSPSFNYSSSMSSNSNSSQKTIDRNIEVKQQINDESTDEEVEQAIDSSNDNKQRNGSFNPIAEIAEPEREIVKPKYVVRPAPLEDDISDSGGSDNSNDECEDDCNNNNNMNYEKNKLKKKLLRKFRQKINDNLALERDVILPILQYVPKSDLSNCMRVCKLWNRYSIDPKLWKSLDLTRKKINSIILMGIVRRQPKRLNLSWSSISRRQLFWLISRLPHLEWLSLQGCSSSTVSALSTCNCPLLQCLDLSWSDSLDDDLIKELLSAPNDSRPGLVETKSRLRFLSQIKLSGSNISDVSIRLMSHQLPFVTDIDISHCHKVTDMGIGVLGTTKANKIKSLNISSSNNITDTSLEALRRCTQLVQLDVRDCPKVTNTGCQHFLCSHQSKSRLIMNEKQLFQTQIN